MLSQDQIDQYHRDGYTVAPAFLAPDRVDAILAEVEGITRHSSKADHDAERMEMEPDQPDAGNRVRRLYEPCSYYPLFRELSDAPALLDAVAQLLGPDLVYHYSKLNMKPAEIGSVVEWHQDLSYYPLTNRDSLAVLFYLDDADAQNGCLKMLPGRHRGDLLDHNDGRYFQGRVTDAIEASQAVDITGVAGTAIFMNGMVPHASNTNNSARDRRTLILSYRAADAFPIYCGEMTGKTEVFSRLVRGQWAPSARFDMEAFPIPQYRQKVVASLYDLQEQSRQEAAQ
ncbi:MAG: phytanoyl-CoA dioxygenase family protein [Candidatus Latescibacteria bacterium]|nr:phytanoyl-CoA dioxygenase family protein [Candidatus Latescibacterota bacterium]